MKSSRLIGRAAFATAATALLLTGQSLAQCPVDDVNEPNDDCFTALSGTIGTVTGLVALEPTVSSDFWTYVVPAGQQLTVDSTFSTLQGDIDMGLWDDAGTCGNLVDFSISVTDNEQVIYANTTTNPVVATVEVQVYTGPGATGGPCADYDLTASLGAITDPCQVAGVDDAEEENDTCLTATVPSAGTLTGLFVSKFDEDFYSASVNPGDAITVDVSHIAANGDIDVDIIDASDCATVLGTAQTVADLETVSYANTSGAAQNVVIRVYVWAGSAADCNNYDLNITTGVDPCSLLPDDGEEENDTCPTAVTPSANPLTGLYVSKSDEDWYTLTVPPNSSITADVLFVTADGDIDCAFIDPADCLTAFDVSVSTTDNEQVTWVNSTASPAIVVLNVIVWTGSVQNCNNYDLNISTSVDPCSVLADDSFEDNDDCTTAASLPNGLTTGLATFLQTVDTDWWTVTLADGATLTVDALFVHANGDLDMSLDDGCTGTQLAISQSVDDNENIVYTNNTGAAQDVALEVFAWQASIPACNSYDLLVDISGGTPSNITPYCFGDGSGTPCPCGNNSTAGHPGGCANSVGNGAVLVATGNASVMADTLNLDLSSASQNSFALLVSGINQLPQMGGCIGCGLAAFDGLRCAGGSFLRHGSRALNASGETGNGWGPPGGPPGGLIAFNGFAAGETRNFFAFYRDDDTAVCQTGQNSSNGVSVTFQP